jgi:DNA-binding IclR family transcriptional regulator
VPGNVQSVERAAAILRLLADEDEPLALAQVASALGLA